MVNWLIICSLAAEFLLVQLNRLFDNLVGLLIVFELAHLHFLFLKFFVVFKKAVDLL